MHYIKITKNQTAKLSSLIQETAKYSSEIAELARDCAEDDVQYAEIVTMKRQISVYERYRTNVQHEIDLILDSLRENIRFAKNDIQVTRVLLGGDGGVVELGSAVGGEPREGSGRTRGDDAGGEDGHGEDEFSFRFHFCSP